MLPADDDEDLKLAMAMSLQHSSPVSSAANEVIDLASDSGDEDDDLRQAIALSLQESHKAASADDTTAQSSTSSKYATTAADESRKPAQRPAVALQPEAPTVTSGSSGFMGFNRQAMEQERLARLGKRKREPSPERPSKQIVQNLSAKVPLSSTTATNSPASVVLQYPRGAIKRTFASGFPRTDDITIDELLEASSVNIAVISSFVFDAEWLYTKLDPTKVKQVWIMNAKDEDTQQRWIREMKETRVPNLKIHFPPMDGMTHSMHSKLMLLFGKDKLRFIVPTANMTQTDWGEVENDWQPGVMENSVFLIDLPRLAVGVVKSRDRLSSFGQGLVHFLEQQKVGQNVIEGVLKFDFSQTGHLAFVHSIGGAHKTESDHPTGLPGLAQAIRDLQLDNVKNVELDYAASSLGAINDTFLQRIHLAARGEPFTIDTKISSVRDHIRIYFPTNETVERSIGGPDCAGIISLTRQYYNTSAFPKECLCDYDSTRRGMLSHNKLLFARGRKKDGQPFAWVYVGSANISESAWGGQKVLKSGKMGSLNIRNWECGVVMRVPEAKIKGLDLDDGQVPPMRVFEGTIEVPFVFPGEQYGGRQPWFFKPG